MNTVSSIADSAGISQPPVVRITPPGRWWVLAVRRALGVSRTDLFFRLARHQGALQANRHRRRLGRLAAAADDACLQPFFRKARAHPVRRACRTRFFITARLLPWMYFAAALQNSTTTIVENQRLVTKVYFPRLALPLSSVLSGLVDFCVSFLMFIVSDDLLPNPRQLGHSDVSCLSCCSRFLRRSASASGSRR